MRNRVSVFSVATPSPRRNSWLSILQIKICREGIQNRLQRDNLSGKLYTPCSSRVSRCLYLHRQLMLPAFLRIRVSLFAKTSLFSFVSLPILQTLFFFFSFPSCFIAEIPRLRFRTFAIKIPLFRYLRTVPFIVGILFWYFCVVAYFWNSFLSSLAFSPSRISPLAWRFPLRRQPRVDSEYGNCSRGNSKNNSLFSAINPNPPRISRRSRDNRAPSTESLNSLERALHAGTREN